MTAPRVRLTGVDEGLDVIVRTRIRGLRTASASRRPSAHCFRTRRRGLAGQANYPSEQDISIEVTQVPLDTLLTKLHDQRILDTALDAMGANLQGTITVFSVERVAAMAGKVTFGLPGHTPLGGVFDIEIRGEGLEDWLLAATHHPGRAHVPRQLGDEQGHGR